MTRLIGKLTFWKALGIVFILGGLVSGAARFIFGLGATTHLSDSTPWGVWIGFDVVTGVGLAAGGFTLCGIVYIFNIKRFKPIVRPTVLTAFLGYLLVVVGLMFDLGRPWAIWHAIVMWNPHSVMFEVAWCVMLYTTVLALEFSPVLLERFHLTKALKVVKAITIPLVIAGILLSMLHQSSLGSLYLIVPEKMHPFWYSPMLPVFFFVSALAVGMGMTIVESYLSARAFNKTLETPLLKDLSRMMVGVASVYVMMRFLDMLHGNKFALVGWNMESGMLALEMALFFAIPLVVHNVRFGQTRLGMFLGAMSVVLGFVTNRLNVAMTSLERYYGNVYFPSIGELFVTAAVVSAGFWIFSLAVKHLPIFVDAHEEKDMVRLTPVMRPVVEEPRTAASAQA
ncbi:MAG: Ni/Fe-hydrogenase cytochrome b subunit [Ignavibacteria bacterium]|nr:Ni/Fe-hydrogenase cytochrome b subunit [Ignavibacteria bacterium]